MISVRHKLVAEGLPPPSWRAPQGRGHPANPTPGAADNTTNPLPLAGGGLGRGSNLRHEAIRQNLDCHGTSCLAVTKTHWIATLRSR